MVRENADVLILNDFSEHYENGVYYWNSPADVLITVRIEIGAPMASLSEPDGERYGQFPSVLSVKTRLGMREQLRAAAAVEKISVGEFVRRTLGEAFVSLDRRRRRSELEARLHSAEAKATRREARESLRLLRTLLRQRVSTDMA